MAVLRPSTPAGHPLISAAWLLGLALIPAGFWRLELLGLGLALVLGGLALYLSRHRAFIGRIGGVEGALAAGQLEVARTLAAPLLERHTGVPMVQKISADVLYATGDPLSAASLYERAAKRLPNDRELVVGLVASYAALNRGGDARRSATLAPGEFDVRLALAWSELVALAGDRANGAMLSATLLDELQVKHGAERTAMTNVLAAIAAAQRKDGVATRAALVAADRQRSALEPADQAFIGYLGGVALRELGAIEDARATFTRAMETRPGSIGEALARRERSHLSGGETA